MIAALEAAAGRRIPYAFGPRRAGDIAACWADAELARRVLGWEVQRSIEQACADGWRWQQQNPNGYRS
jgi:UDP-glucose 4-epimerase